MSDRAFRGKFSGILDWERFDAFWQRLTDAPEGWFVFDPEGEAPTAPISAKGFAEFLDQARPVLEARRRLGHCGVIYVDDPAAPNFVKMFDPVNMGSSCSVGGAPVLPKWVLSRMQPDALPKPDTARPGFWSRVVGG